MFFRVHIGEGEILHTHGFAAFSSWLYLGSFIFLPIRLFSLSHFAFPSPFFLLHAIQHIEDLWRSDTRCGSYHES